MVVRPVKICDLEPGVRNEVPRNLELAVPNLWGRTGRMLLCAGPRKSSAVDRFCETVPQEGKISPQDPGERESEQLTHHRCR